MLVAEGKLPKYQAFLRREYGFSQNFKFAVLPENKLVQLKYNSLKAAIEALESIVADFFTLILKEDFQYIMYPYYRKLDRDDSI